MNNKPPTMDRQYSMPEKHAKLSHDNPDNPFDYTVEEEGTPATQTRIETIVQLEETIDKLEETIDKLKKENKNIKGLLTEAAHDRQVCINELNFLKKNLPSKGGRKSRKKRGGRKSRRRNTKKRKTNRKKRKINRKKRKTKRRR